MQTSVKLNPYVFKTVLHNIDGVLPWRTNAVKKKNAKTNNKLKFNYEKLLFKQGVIMSLYM